jgi:hypothetical protein
MDFLRPEPNPKMRLQMKKGDAVEDAAELEIGVQKRR